jgi:glycine/D-amino acid oxidase-like deaminating enzyme
LIGTGVGALGAAAAGTYFLGGPGGALAPGVSRARPVAGDSVLPSDVEVVVIGGGFVGCAAALMLAERGIPVALCEKGVIAGEASGRSLGLVESSWLDAVKQPLLARTKELWADMNRLVAADTGYRATGGVSPASSDEDFEAAKGWLASVQGGPGVDSRMIDARELARYVPQSPIAWKGGLLSPGDAQAEPRLAAPAMADAARRHGARILQHCAVRGIETKAGRIEAVVTEKGRIRTRVVVLAGGIWSPVFARSLGLELPQFAAYSSQMSVTPVGGPTVAGAANGIAWRREPDGGYSLCITNGAAPITPTTLSNLPRLMPAFRHLSSELDPVFSPSTFLREWNMPRTWKMDEPSPFEQIRILQPEVRTKKLDKCLAIVRDTFPVFRDATVRERYAGALVSTLDNMPVVSPVSAIPGLLLGTGVYYGLTMGPAIGEALADMATGRTPQFDVKPYRFERFSDGSALPFRL